MSICNDNSNFQYDVVAFVMEIGSHFLEAHMIET